ncbi:hypothetical protein [Arthrobacter russicus]|uniref:Uncharacterized protein n=1 Tax=Arthrobacter russicus TaxID=172040 RepID=A0ABU1JDX2_9MICC|nr:hypothetical protein [Arthrobacter russicus]MDR6270641.1 hypothetical protein [Arthrobacter russicus]
MSEQEKRRLLRALEKNRKLRDKAIHERDDLIREAFKAGIPRAAIAEMTGMSMAHIYHIAKSA